MHCQALLAFVPAAPRPIPVTLTPRQLLALWQQLIVAASTKSYRDSCLYDKVHLTNLLFISYEAVAFISEAIVRPAL